MTYKEWVSQSIPQGYRPGQHLFNTLPRHLAGFIAGSLWLDPFHATDVYDVRYLRFVAFCELAWDCTTKEELNTAWSLIREDMRLS